jgi:hypothetical protein
MEAEQLRLGRRQFGRDVIVQVGYWRFWQHLTVAEIYQRLHTDLRLPISERQVLDLLGDFLALLSAAQPAKLDTLRPQLAELGGLIIGIDGMQPEKGNACLYVLREPRLELTLLAESLEESSAPTLQRELMVPLKALASELDLPLLGVVSDAQESIRLAVAAELPGIPHHSCHFHCLRDAGSLTFEADRSLKTALKKALRQPLAALERRIHRLPANDPFRPILADYADAIRSTLLEGGVAPFELGGVRVFDDLTHLAASLVCCQEKGGIRSWTACCVLPTDADPLLSNEINWFVNASGSSTWIVCLIPPSHPRVPLRLQPKWTATCWSCGPRPTRVVTSATSKWPLTLTGPSAIAGGASSPATKSKACLAPITSWKRSYGASKRANGVSPVARMCMPSSCATDGLWPILTTTRVKTVSWHGYAGSNTKTSSTNESSWSPSRNVLPNTIAFVTGELSFCTSWKLVGSRPTSWPGSTCLRHNILYAESAATEKKWLSEEVVRYLVPAFGVLQ